MPDLFAYTRPRIEPIDRTVGKGNALFLADLALGLSAEQTRVNHKAGKYPDLNTRFATANLKFRGMV